MQAAPHPEKTVVYDDPDYDSQESVVEFRLTYAGELWPSTNNSPRARHKHEIRKKFHPQLRRLWETTPNLANMRERLPTDIVSVNDARPRGTRIDALVKEFARINYHFVPLVTEDLSLWCGVDILFLRPNPPGKVIESGDIDNRIKTLFDALKMPKQRQELGGYDVPGADEEPFFCLLEDDSLVARVAVETDTLLEPVDGIPDRADARLVITVTLRPSTLTIGNLGFV